MALPTIRNVTAPAVSGTGAGQPPAIPRPAGVLNTDVVVLICSAGAGSNASAAPAGFATWQADGIIQGARLAVYAKVVGADTSWTVTYPTAPTSGNNVRVLPLFLAGAAGMDAKGALTAPAAASTALVLPGPTTAGPDRLALVIGTNKAGSTAWATSVQYSGGATPAVSEFPGTAFNPAIAVGVLSRPAAGPVPSQTMTWDFSTINQGGVVIAVSPTSVALSSTTSVTPESGTAPLTVSSTISAAGGTGTPYTYHWSWGDGTTTGPQAGATASHTYSEPGTYTITGTPANS
jgi:hypothetical protein